MYVKHLVCDTYTDKLNSSVEIYNWPQSLSRQHKTFRFIISLKHIFKTSSHNFSQFRQIMIQFTIVGLVAFFLHKGRQNNSLMLLKYQEKRCQEK